MAPRGVKKALFADRPPTSTTPYHVAYEHAVATQSAFDFRSPVVGLCTPARIDPYVDVGLAGLCSSLCACGTEEVQVWISFGPRRTPSGARHTRTHGCDLVNPGWSGLALLRSSMCITNEEEACKLSRLAALPFDLNSLIDDRRPLPCGIPESCWIPFLCLLGTP